VLTSFEDVREAKDLRRHRGWSYKDWEGVVYPAQLKKSQHPAEYMARYIDVLEINTSFYGHIKPEWGKLWCRKAHAVNPEFMFTAMPLGAPSISDVVSECSGVIPVSGQLEGNRVRVYRNGKEVVVDQVAQSSQENFPLLVGKTLAARDSLVATQPALS
jgi:hypothetical protein